MTCPYGHYVYLCKLLDTFISLNTFQYSYSTSFLYICAAICRVCLMVNHNKSP